MIPLGLLITLLVVLAAWAVIAIWSHLDKGSASPSDWDVDL